MNKKKMNELFPIVSQTSIYDKNVLIEIINFLSKDNMKFKYLEIGSYLGGSLTPFLKNDYCSLVFSIDKRNQNLEDERGKIISYKNTSLNQMLDNLKKFNLNTKKLKTFNGDVKNFKKKIKFDLVFIDGIHTDINTFSDFLNSLKLLKKNGIILFHDSSIIFKSIKIIEVFLKQNNFKFSLVKFKDSEITGIFFNLYSRIFFKHKKFKFENFNKFIKNAENNLLMEQINNRLKIKFKISRFIKKKFPYKLSLITNKKILKF